MKQKKRKNKRHQISQVAVNNITAICFYVTDTYLELRYYGIAQVGDRVNRWLTRLSFIRPKSVMEGGDAY